VGALTGGREPEYTRTHGLLHRLLGVVALRLTKALDESAQSALPARKALPPPGTDPVAQDPQSDGT
jgi:hypothetical protein